MFGLTLSAKGFAASTAELPVAVVVFGRFDGRPLKSGVLDPCGAILMGLLVLLLGGLDGPASGVGASSGVFRLKKLLTALGFESVGFCSAEVGLAAQLESRCEFIRNSGTSDWQAGLESEDEGHKAFASKVSHR